MRFACFALALALSAVSVAAQDNKEATPSTTSVLVNGQAIKGKVLEMDGRHFVAVEDLAQSLRGTISYGAGQIALTLPQFPSAPTQAPSSPVPSTSTVIAPPQRPPLPAQTPPPQPLISQAPATTAPPAETGRVKGTLTYFFSFHIGTKPDAGSKVWLVKGHVEIPANQNFVGSSTALGTSGNPEQYAAIKYAITDDNGNFELLDIPPGEYTLIIQSAHTKWTLNEKNHLFASGNSHNPRDSNGRVEFFKLQVKAGETSDASKDFGPNIDM
jgi:hypothetical protein